MKLAISEVFYSLQGEGKTIGVPSVFVRLGGCNLMCGGQGTQFDKELHNDAKWRCDTIEVWMKAKGIAFDQILNDECITALKMGANLVITGGEPTMQPVGLNKFIRFIRKNINPDTFIEVETNGSNIPNLKTIDQWNVSPKLSNSGNDKNQRFNKEALEEFNELNTQFKFVISDESDLIEVLKDFDFIDKKKIWLMPAGENQELLKITKEKVAKMAIVNYFNYTTRLHIDLWNKKTGV